MLHIECDIRPLIRKYSSDILYYIIHSSDRDPKVRRHLIKSKVRRNLVTQGVWSSGMILLSGRRGQEFDSPNAPGNLFICEFFFPEETEGRNGFGA